MPKSELSQTEAAIASRKRRADAKAAKSGAGDREDNVTAAAAGNPSTATIGVQTPEKRAAQKYHCPNCDEDATTAMPECPTCGQNFDWPKE